MSEEKLYSIGEAGRICNISKKALRFYDQIGVIAPDYINRENGYRYYSRESLLTLSVLKYYKQMGFRLEEMQEIVSRNNDFVVKEKFQGKIGELRTKVRELYYNLEAVEEWYNLIQEAQMVRKIPVHEVFVRYVPPTACCFMEQDFCYEYKESIINIQWVNHLEEEGIEISGPVIIKYPSWVDKMTGKAARASIMQRPLRPMAGGAQTCRFGGFMAVCVYHVGPIEAIDMEYGRIRDWAEARGHVCSAESYERYVVDHWTTRNPGKFVTEIIIPLIQKEKDDVLEIRA
ncbi:MAG: MerR family transcriptional regulator [Eubacteriales bacterium]|nr:MerR family transcriptional regulator [Eubacteriales bacterium]